MMTPSEACRKITEEFEGCRLHAYQDTGGVWTIGYGHTNNVRPGQVVDQTTAELLLQHDQDSASAFVNNHGGECTQNQFDAFVDFCFNVGPSAFLTSTLLRKHKSGDHAGAAEEFLKWKYDNHVVVPGLLRRRVAERALYLGQ